MNWEQLEGNGSSIWQSQGKVGKTHGRRTLPYPGRRDQLIGKNQERYESRSRKPKTG